MRVIGGNQVGIFVSAVQDDSPAALHSIRPGDRILSVNDKPMIGVTREEVGTIYQLFWMQPSSSLCRGQSLM